ncbi:MAG: NAD-dependent epimerase/dehydratase family protein, partial [Dehalococcoidia bacterium]|nr:NAD-dependent epimerase/dehydratase family protein [Dehalococcoidia bacterium]
FIGSHTVDRLLQRGYTVRVLDNLHPRVHPRGKPLWLSPDAEFIQGDVTSRTDWERALEDVDAVIHLAAYQDYMPDFSTFFRVNTAGTALLYEIIVGRKLPIRKVVVASSQAVYGEGRYRCGEHGVVYPGMRPLAQLEAGDWEVHCPHCQRPMHWEPTDESVVNPQNAYAMSKYAQEMVALNLGKRYGIPTTALRYSIVQGPRQSFANAYSGVCRIFCLSLFLGRPLVVYEDGRQVRDYVNIHDAVDATMLALEDPRTDYQVYNVGGGRPYTVLEFAQMVVAAFGKGGEIEVPGVFRFGDTRHIVSDISRLRALGWEPRYTPQDSIRAYIAWLTSQECSADLLDYAQAQMRAQGVLRTVAVRA